MSIFGPIVTGQHVRAAVEATIKLWAPDYLAEVGERSGRERCDLPGFRSYVSAVDLDRFAEDQLPSCCIVAPGLASAPEKRGQNGAYMAEWSVGVGAVVMGPDRETTYELVELYAAAIRALILHHPSLGEFAAGVRWVDERYDDLPFEDSRTIAAGVVQFNVGVETAVDSYGPTVPSEDPCDEPGDWATVQTVIIDEELLEEIT